MHVFCLLHALSNLKQPGIGVNTAKGLLFQTRCGQSLLYFGNQPAAHRALSAVYHQYPVTALLDNQLAHLCLGTWTKDNLGGKRKGKCMHEHSSLFISFL